MESIWTKETKIRERAPLPGDLETEVVVIGAGLTGILTAYYLQQAEVKTVVLEADRIGSGQTKNTTGKITSQHNLCYDWIMYRMLKRKAFAYAWAHEDAIKEYERLITEKGIECDFVKCPSYLYALDKTKPLWREEMAAAEVGIDATYVTECELPFPITGALRFDDQAQFHPLKFLAAMAEEVTVYEKTRALTVEENRVETDRGCVSAKYVVFACHFPFVNVPGYYFARVFQERSYVLALEGAEPLKGMYQGIGRDKLFIRSYGDLLLVSGAGHRTGANKRGGHYEKLRRQVQELFPDCREVAHWSAQDCMTLDGVPYIGQYSEKRPTWYVATGFGKWGMTTAMASAQIITARITKQKIPIAYAFYPHREYHTDRADRVLLHAFYSIRGFAKRLLPSGNKEIVPTCPHMGCRLEWNPEEQTYDCPCHGSRFDKEGHLMEGPAQKDCRRR